jgi:hypothetical protein
MTNGSMVVPFHTGIEVPTRRPNLPLTLGSSLKETVLPQRLKPLMSAQLMEMVARGSMKAPWLNEPKR